jgi:RimJ/RimL family protein N-acetyltransferase
MKDRKTSGPGPVVLFTPHLRLVAATLDHVRAELESPGLLASLLEAEVAEGWPPGEYDRDAQEFFRDRLVEGDPSLVGWYGWYAVQREEPGRQPALIGAGGYLGPPNERGEVEIGFSMMPLSRNRGYATEVARALVLNALNDARVRVVLARTAPDNIASVGVLTKSGFELVGPDPDSDTCLFHRKRD